MKTRHTGLSDRALEMIMREVMDGLEELCCQNALRSLPGGCTVIDIRPPQRQSGGRTGTHPDRAEVIDFFGYRKAAGGG